MENFKIRVKSPENSKKIQEHLFSLGYEWRTRIGDEIKYIDKKYLLRKSLKKMILKIKKYYNLF